MIAGNHCLVQSFPKAGTDALPKAFSLGQNYPNPFNPTTKIEYWVPEGAPGAKAGVNVTVYDVRGARVKTLPLTPEKVWRAIQDAKAAIPDTKAK
jgi:hypothetical protein